MTEKTRTENTLSGEENWLYRSSGNIYLKLGHSSSTQEVRVRTKNNTNIITLDDAGKVTSRSLSVENAAGTETFGIDTDGYLSQTKTLSKPLDLYTGCGTSTVEIFNDAPSINLDADGESFYGSFGVPNQWDEASDLTIVMMVANEIAEDDGDDVSITCQVRGYADGDTTSAAGQTVACTLDLTGGDQAINVINRVTGTIDYNHGTYPIDQGDTVVIEAIVNLGGAGECTGPLHVIAWWIEYTADRLGA